MEVDIAWCGYCIDEAEDEKKDTRKNTHKWAGTIDYQSTKCGKKRNRKYIKMPARNDRTK